MVTVNFTQSEYVVPEGPTEMMICLVANSLLERDVLVTVQSQSLTAQSKFLTILSFSAT